MKVFVITGESGEYSDYGMWNMCPCYSEDRAKELVEKINKLAKYEKEFKCVRHDFIEKYDKEHPYPRLEVADYNKYGSIRGPEKGNKQDQIRYRQLLEKQRVLTNAHIELKHEAEELWLKQNHNPPSECEEVKHLNVSNDGRSRYSYQELDII